jgi:hypothetical protein
MITFNVPVAMWYGALGGQIRDRAFKQKRKFSAACREFFIGGLLHRPFFSPWRAW